MMVKVENCGGHNPAPLFTSLMGSIEAAPGCEHPTLTNRPAICKVEDGHKVESYLKKFSTGGRLATISKGPVY
jgi:hypothetical protein